jgi:hypothetical protein
MKVFCLLLTVGTFTSVFQDKSHKTVGIKVFLNFLLVMGVSGSIQIITYPDPGGPKIFGSGPLVLRLIDSPWNCFFKESSH